MNEILGMLSGILIVAVGLVWVILAVFLIILGIIYFFCPCLYFYEESTKNAVKFDYESYLRWRKKYPEDWEVKIHYHHLREAKSPYCFTIWNKISETYVDVGRWGYVREYFKQRKKDKHIAKMLDEVAKDELSSIVQEKTNNLNYNYEKKVEGLEKQDETSRPQSL